MGPEDMIGKLVISSNFGVGKVVDVDDAQAGDRTFLVVEDFKNKSRNFISSGEKRKMRKISSLAALEDMIDSLAETEGEEREFSSKRERIEYFKKSSKEVDLSTLRINLLLLSGLEDRSSVEEQIFNRLLDLVADELAVVGEITFDEARLRLTQKIG